MIAPVDGWQLAGRVEQEPAQGVEQWMTRRAEIEAAAIAKRQLGFEVTLGNAVFSIGLDSNGLPAFTVTAAPVPIPTIPAASDTPAVDTNLPATEPVVPLTTAVPAPVPTTDVPVNTIPANSDSAAVPTPLPSDTSQDIPADSSQIIVDTASGNTVLPTSPLITLGGLPSTAVLSSTPISSLATTSSRLVGTGVTTQIIFAGGTPVTSVVTMGAAATPQSSHLSPPEIAGAVVGAVGGTAALLLLLVLCVRWRRHVRDNKRMSHGGESIRALHTGPAPMMAHNSARYTNMFPQGGAVAVDDDARSSRMAFLPAGAAGFLNRASGSPLRASSHSSHIHNDAVAMTAQPNTSERLPSTFLAHPRSITPNPTRSREVSFLAADASTWLNRNSNGPPARSSSPLARVGSPLARVGSPLAQSRSSGLPPPPMLPITAMSHDASTRSLPSQVDSMPNNGQVNFLPADASGFLNRSSAIPSPTAGSGSNQMASLPAATTAASSTHSLPSQIAAGPDNGQVTFLPADASGFLNRNSSVPTQYSGPGSPIGSHPTAALAASSSHSLPSQNASVPDNGQVPFLPADASGFLNRSSASPPPANDPPYPIHEPSFQKVSGYKVPSPFDTAGQAGPSTVNFSAPVASLAIPAPAHVLDRDSARPGSNHSINNDSEWFSSDTRDSRSLPIAAVTAAAGSHLPASAANPSFVSNSNSEIDEFLNASGPSTQPPVPRRSPDRVQQQPFAPPQFGTSSAHTSPDAPSDATTSRQDFGFDPTYQPSPARSPDVREAPPSAQVPGQQYNSPWGNSPPALPMQPQWPGMEHEQQSWVQHNSPEAMVGGSENQTMSWPRPPDVDWNRPRVRPKDAF